MILIPWDDDVKLVWDAGSSHRYGFDGHERLDEVSGSGNTIDIGDRWLDVRLGRTLKTDTKAYLFRCEPIFICKQ